MYVVGEKAETDFNVTMKLPFAWNASLCASQKCKIVKIQTCVQLEAPEGLFPKSRCVFPYFNILSFVCDHSLLFLGLICAMKDIVSNSNLSFT